MKRMVALMVLLALGAAWSTPIHAQDTGAAKSNRRADKKTQQQQKALYAYQKRQEKAQAKLQRKADKQQRKAAKKYEKEQRRLLKNANRPVKHKS